jgi:purine-binding chemotaxis protein CheW
MSTAIASADTTIRSGTAVVDNAPQQVLTFRLGEETYGIDILRVREIRGWAPVTRIPESPPHMLGVLNLRGSLVPIVDMRVRFRMEHIGFTPLTVIIVLSVAVKGIRRDVGLVVDSVSEVVDIGSSSLQQAPNVGARIDTTFIQGIATVSECMMILLDIEKLISGGMDIAASTPDEAPDEASLQ